MCSKSARGSRLPDLARQSQGERDGPLRHDSGVHHEIGALGVCQRTRDEPLEERLPVGRLEHLVQGVNPAGTAGAVSDREQMQIVVSEHYHRVVPE
jgi:hypothetical protein